MKNIQPKLLATTALEKTWGSDESILFLGEWCMLYDRKEIWSKRDYTINPYHWDDRNKLKSDNSYLQRLYEQILQHMYPVLNNYHEIERPPKYWRLILAPWLITYIAVIFDRWECLKIVFENNEYLKIIEDSDISYKKNPCDYAEFINDVLGDFWNYNLYLDIIKSEYYDKIIIEDNSNLNLSNLKTSNLYPSKARQSPRNNYLSSHLHRMLGKLSFSNPALFYSSYFTPLSLIKLNLLLRQVPCINQHEFAHEINCGIKKNESTARTINFKWPVKNSFESYLLGRIATDIPYSYIEGFSELKRKANALTFRPKVILTANAHWGNELFKIFSSEQICNNGVKFVTMEHGGCIPPLFGTMNFEEDIADFRTTWTVPYHPKHVQLPPNKLAGFKIKSSNEYCAVVGFEIPRYPYRVQSAPISAQSLVHFNQVMDFYNSLDNNIQKLFRIRPYITDQGWNTKQRFIDALGEGCVSTDGSYHQFLTHARVIICTYPETTFSEAMASGVPTLLLYPEHLWEREEKFNYLISKFKENNIVFNSPSEAARHLNKIWSDPHKWWNSSQLKECRETFHYYLGRNNSKGLREWADFIKNTIKE